MQVHFKLLPEAVVTAGVEGKESVLEAVAERFAAVYKVDREAVLESLLEREALGSTGFGRGIAIPHARITGISRPVAVLLRLKEAIDFAAADGMPVELVFGLLSPQNAGASHLQALAAISRIVRDETMHRALVESADGEALFALLTNHLDRDAA